MTKIDYQETTEDLKTRINIHDKYGSRDIDEWMLGLLKLEKSSKILDVGCGSGKQLKSYHNYLDGEAEIVGGDVNQELLDQARDLNAEFGNAWTIMDLDFDKRFPFDDGEFDLVSCCFAIYYANDIPFTIAEMHRALKPGGQLFTTGPMPENKQLFYDVIKEATDTEIPPMPGSSRYASEILSAVKERFSETELHIFENPLVFDAVEPFLAYTGASLSEDRRLWKGLFQGKEGYQKVMRQIEEVAHKRFECDGELVMTKVVGGILAEK
ncbi:MAG: class I SAM-dependent methyltransferase [Anaerolineales bacterium]|nr:class I SAM-dependent methyltransferase [Anaerolineales bacterium]